MISVQECNQSLIETRYNTQINTNNTIALLHMISVQECKQVHCIVVRNAQLYTWQMKEEKEGMLKGRDVEGTGC